MPTNITPTNPPAPDSGYSVLSSSATTSTGNTPIITVGEEGSVSYSEINNSIGTYVYGMVSLYMSALNFEQFNNNIQVVTVDSNGNSTQTSLILPIDPFQTAPSYLLDLKSKGIVVDGNTFFQITLDPLENVLIQMKTVEIRFQDFIKGKDPFKEQDLLLEQSEYFKEYQR
jgi:hypothetical protein